MKTSHIMQAYLGDYPGSRSNSDKKFLRAVQSFVDQTDKNSELIIVSDGCQIVHKLYYKHYKDNDRIKYIYVDKDTPNMYEGEQKYYRGLPREVGRTLVTGAITTYIDSDDYLLPNAVEMIKNAWDSLKQHNLTAIYNSGWIDNYIMVGREDLMGSTNICVGEPFTVNGLDSKWIVRSMSDVTLVLSSTWSMIHRSDFEGKWEDTIGKISEDVYFSKKLQASKMVGVINRPYYVRCHYSNLWDY
jgi:glycosyltransferase involved in cell wall biosynthesis